MNEIECFLKGIHFNVLFENVEHLHCMSIELLLINNLSRWWAGDIGHRQAALIQGIPFITHIKLLWGKKKTN